MKTSESSLEQDFLPMELPLMPSVEDFPAKTCQLPEKRPASRQIEAAFGQKLQGLLARLDRASCSWRTLQTCLLAQVNNQADGLAEFSQTWPRSGMMLDGNAYQLPTLAPLTDGIASGLLPTQRANDAKKRGNFNVNDLRNGFPAAAKRLMLPTPMTGSNSLGGGPTNARKAWRRLLLPTVSKCEFKGSSRDRFKGSASFRGAKMSEGLRSSEGDPIYLNPPFAEVVMGFPIGWTELQPVETQSSPKSQNS